MPCKECFWPSSIPERGSAAPRASLRRPSGSLVHDIATQRDRIVIVTGSSLASSSALLLDASLCFPLARSDALQEFSLRSEMSGSWSLSGALVAGKLSSRAPSSRLTNCLRKAKGTISVHCQGRTTCVVWRSIVLTATCCFFVPLSYALLCLSKDVWEVETWNIAAEQILRPGVFIEPCDLYECAEYLIQLNLKSS